MSSLNELKLINSQLARANSDIDRLKTVRLNTILACLNNGISVKEISDALELSRQRVYKIIESR